MKRMKIILFLLTISTAIPAKANENELCPAGGTNQIFTNTLRVCGTGENNNKELAKILADDASTATFNRFCKENIECSDFVSKITITRSECFKNKNETYGCYIYKEYQWTTKRKENIITPTEKYYDNKTADNYIKHNKTKLLTKSMLKSATILTASEKWFGINKNKQKCLSFLLTQDEALKRLSVLKFNIESISFYELNDKDYTVMFRIDRIKIILFQNNSSAGFYGFSPEEYCILPGDGS